MPAAALRIRLIGGDAAGLRWQLVARNGRAVATSCARFADVESALAALADLHAAIAHLAPNFSHPSSSVRWEWTVVNQVGLAMASSGRSYDRYGTCVAAYRRFIAMAASFPPPYGLDG